MADATPAYQGYLRTLATLARSETPCVVGVVAAVHRGLVAVERLSNRTYERIGWPLSSSQATRLLVHDGAIVPIALHCTDTLLRPPRRVVLRMSHLVLTRAGGDVGPYLPTRSPPQGVFGYVVLLLPTSATGGTLTLTPTSTLLRWRQGQDGAILGTFHDAEHATFDSVQTGYRIALVYAIVYTEHVSRLNLLEQLPVWASQLQATATTYAWHWRRTYTDLEFSVLAPPDMRVVAALVGSNCFDVAFARILWSQRDALWIVVKAVLHPESQLLASVYLAGQALPAVLNATPTPPDDGAITTCLVFWSRLHRHRLPGFRRTLTQLERVLQHGLGACATHLVTSLIDMLFDASALPAHRYLDVPDAVQLGRVLTQYRRVVLLQLLVVSYVPVAVTRSQLGRFLHWLPTAITEVGCDPLASALLQLVDEQTCTWCVVSDVLSFLVDLMQLSERSETGDFVKMGYQRLLPQLLLCHDAPSTPTASRRIVSALLCLENFAVARTEADVRGRLARLPSSVLGTIDTYLQPSLMSVLAARADVWDPMSVVAPVLVTLLDALPALHVPTYVAYVLDAFDARPPAFNATGLGSIFALSPSRFERCVERYMGAFDSDIALASVKYLQRIETVPPLVHSCLLTSAMLVLAQVRRLAAGEHPIPAVLPAAVEMLYRLGFGHALVGYLNALTPTTLHVARRVLLPVYDVVVQHAPGGVLTELLRQLVLVHLASVPPVHRPDWALAAPALPCHCAMCSDVHAFLASPTRGAWEACVDHVCVQLDGYLRFAAVALASLGVLVTTHDARLLLQKHRYHDVAAYEADVATIARLSEAAPVK
ncbi:hypothetical protein, variant [Saprolegnia diclina VS20]|uniref:Uncharacterized protein n=1 Tax=Saprolegnia diclina (strain VS20) TaxID=1156394 RepID=T0PME4_SAPDV|nr:hypothetical protein, variant [Saprolegnia diclina VS20]EQC26554.1 hypothetical protein, variant [Saprolegnia diclina VS20]|eukprot:XP_008620046.1 hypothetical protein, variant [Saprolegnia diclina VS20]